MVWTWLIHHPIESTFREIQYALFRLCLACSGKEFPSYRP